MPVHLPPRLRSKELILIVFNMHVASAFRIRQLGIAVLLLFIVAHSDRSVAFGQETPPDWVTQKTVWNGFDQWHFQVAGRSAYVVLPEKAATGQPWVWRARFPGYHAEMDIELLKQGFHIVYLDVAGLFGAPVAIDAADQCYQHVQKHLELAPRAAMEGVSRGGLFVYQYLLRYPDRVACLYADTPVCDFKSWPGGKGESKGSSGDWTKCLEAYKMDEATALAFQGNPVDQAEAIARSGVPLLHIISMNDRVVPVEENTLLLKQQVEKWGGTLSTIEVKEGTEKSQGHHFDHPAVDQVVDFIKRHAGKGIVPPQSSLPKRPNIVLFLVDDMGWQDTSVPFHESTTPFNRRYRTPNMERLAQEGVKFTQAYACSVCSPTRISLMSGQNAARHRVTNWTLRLNASNDRGHPQLEFPHWNVNGMSPVEGIERTVHCTPLPRLLKDSGYRTIHVGKAHFGAITTPAENPLAIGFDINIGGHAAGGPGSYLGTQNFSAAWRKGDRVWDIPGLDSYHGKDIFLTDALTREALKEVDQAVEDEQPFFLYMAHYAVHVPFAADSRFIQSYRDEGLTETEAMYAALVEGMDDSLGEILNRLDEHQIADDTLVIFISDNGGLSAHGRSGPAHQHNRPLSSGKGSAHEGGVRVPMLVRWPNRAPAHQTCTQSVMIEDLYPTILSAAHVAGPRTDFDHLDGHSVIDWILQPDLPHDRKPLLWHFPNHWGPQGPGIGPSSSLRRGPWKLIYYHASGDFELFNLEDDLGESTNLYASHPEIAGSMKLELAERLRQLDAQMPRQKSSGTNVPWPDES
jgi:arylsulfatase A-like enzyme/pimeloyl-ACP methyl ester carboxylesterase